MIWWDKEEKKIKILGFSSHYIISVGPTHGPWLRCLSFSRLCRSFHTNVWAGICCDRIVSNVCRETNDPDTQLLHEKDKTHIKLDERIKNAIQLKKLSAVNVTSTFINDRISISGWVGIYYICLGASKREMRNRKLGTRKWTKKWKQDGNELQSGPTFST